MEDILRASTIVSSLVHIEERISTFYLFVAPSCLCLFCICLAEEPCPIRAQGFLTKSLFFPCQCQYQSSSRNSCMFRTFLRRHHPLLLNFTSASALLTLGDFTIQIFYEKQKQLNQQRLFAASVTGGLIGVEGHLWYTYLDRRLVQTSWHHVWKKVFLDQAIATPIYTMTFILGTSYLEGRQSYDELKHDIQANFLPLFLADCFLFLPIQIVNFKYIPSSYRVIFLSVVAFIFDACIIAFKHRPV